MDVNALFWTKHLAVEARNAMLRKFDHRDQLAAMFFHVNDVGWTYRITDSAAGTFVQVDINYHFCFPRKKWVTLG